MLPVRQHQQPGELTGLLSLSLSLTQTGEGRLPIREPWTGLSLKKVRESFSFPVGKLDSRNNLRVVSAFNDIF